MYNALTIGVYGMIESKRKDVKQKQLRAAEMNEEQLEKLEKL